MDVEEIDDIEDLPVSPQIRIERATGYGHVPGLDDDELLDEQELETWVEWQDWGPIWALPETAPRSTIRPTINENGRADWGAFGTVDFERIRGPFDKARYKADQLAEELRRVLISVDIVRARLPQAALYLTLKYLGLGIVKDEHVASDDLRTLLRLTRRAQQLREEIWELRASSRRRQEARAEQALDTLTRD
jgi:hypothetical protein